MKTRSREDVQPRRQAAAMVEAIIALPVLVVTLIAAPYLHALLSAHQHALASARGAAWRSALSGCRDVAVDAGQPVDVSAVADSAAVHASSRFSSVDAVPVVGDMLSTLAPSLHCGAANDTVRRPLLLGGTDDAISGSACFTCNEVPTDPWDAIFSLFESFLPGASRGRQ